MTNERQTSSSTIAIVVLVVVILLGLVTVVVCGGAGILYLRINRMSVPPQEAPSQPIPQQVPPPKELPPEQQPAEAESGGMDARETHSARDDRIEVFKTSRPFVIQPGERHAVLTETFGEPTFDRADNQVERTVGASGDVWRRAVYHANIPINVPFGEDLSIIETNVVLSFQYRTDTGTIWSVGVRDHAGIFHNSIGALDLSMNLTKAKEKLGHPKESKRYSPPLILERVVWEGDELIYVCEFLTEPHSDPPVTYNAGDMHSLDVFAARHAPEGYVQHLLNME